jgi:hypothetical protein
MIADNDQTRVYAPGQRLAVSGSSDVNPLPEVELIYGIRNGLDATENTERTQALEREVTAALGDRPPTCRARPGPSDARPTRPETPS